MRIWHSTAPLPPHRVRRGFGLNRAQQVASARRMQKAGLERYLSATERRLLHEADSELH